LEQIQNELRDSDTMILEYALGDERSYLWAITFNSFHSYELAPGKEIEDLAGEVYKLISVRRVSSHANGEASDKDYSEKVAQLSQMLLGPLAGQLEDRRLIIIPEGALQYIPFEVLHLPTGPLIKTNEVVASPSISTLIEIRRARQHTSSTSKLVAVIADPVFSTSDDRVQSQATSSSSAQAATEQNPSEVSEPAFARLAHASEEADKIFEKAPWGTTLVAKGFDASRKTAMSAEIGQYQIIHFATHGVLNSERPELSGIALTSVDRNGVNTKGFMSLQDIYNLNLSAAELTVLSACQTALGKDVKGEGFIGLTHGILSAGSKSVVASLWKVDDRATAVLMGHFYDAMLQQGMSPAAALRSAKLQMMHDKQWNEPYFWAGFVLQGEYTNHIAVDHYSWTRSPLMFLFLLLPIAAGLLIYQRRKRSTKST
jgi:CHAT domain-containing protein